LVPVAPNLRENQIILRLTTVLELLHLEKASFTCRWIFQTDREEQVLQPWISMRCGRNAIRLREREQILRPPLWFRRFDMKPGGRLLTSFMGIHAMQRHVQ